MGRKSKKRQLKELNSQTKIAEKDLVQIRAGNGSNAIAWGNNSNAHSGGGINNQKIHVGN